MKKERITNREFAKSDIKFNHWCSIDDVSPTRRQASKFRNKKGEAYKASKASKGLHP